VELQARVARTGTLPTKTTAGRATSSVNGSGAGKLSIPLSKPREEVMQEKIETGELRDPKGMSAGVYAFFNGHGYHCYKANCLHKDPSGAGSEYTFKQGKWVETRSWKQGKWVEQFTEVTNAALVRDLNTVNEKLRLLIQSLKINEGQKASLVR
jgi:hypothetical protein